MGADSCPNISVFLHLPEAFPTLNSSAFYAKTMGADSCLRDPSIVIFLHLSEACPTPNSGNRGTDSFLRHNPIIPVFLHLSEAFPTLNSSILKSENGCSYTPVLNNYARRIYVAVFFCVLTF